MVRIDRRGFEDHGDGIWKNRVQPFLNDPNVEPNTLVQMENENLVPPAAIRQEFAAEIRSVIRREMLGGEEKMTATSETFGDIEFFLPPETQLMDFVAIEPTDDPSEVDITVNYPHRRTDVALRTTYWTQSFRYKFPVPYQLFKQS